MLDSIKGTQLRDASYVLFFYDTIHLDFFADFAGCKTVSILLKRKLLFYLVPKCKIFYCKL